MHKKIISLILSTLIIGLLAACAGTSPTNNGGTSGIASATSTPRGTPTTIPPTNTPRPTQTPLPETKLSYHLEILDSANGEARVSVKIENFYQSQWIFGRGQPGGSDRVIPPGTNLTANTDFSETDLQRRIESYRFEHTPDHILEFSYDVSLNSGYAAYNVMNWHLDDRFGAAEPEYLLLFPTDGRGDYLNFSNIEISVSMPEDWILITHWEENGGTYSANSSAEFLLGFIAFGNFNVQTRQIGGMEVTMAAYGLSEAEEAQFTETMFDLYEYYTHMMGDISTTTWIPRDKYLLLVLPPTEPPNFSGGFYINQREAAYGYFTSNHFRIHDQAHRMFHEWNSDSGSSFCSPVYFFEGFTTFFEHYGLYQTGHWTEDQFLVGLGLEYQSYLDNRDIKGYDVPLYYDMSKALNTEIYYTKGAVVGYMLHKAILSVTDGQSSLEDVMSIIFKKGIQESNGAEWPNCSYDISDEDLLEIVNDLTGHDFSDFFRHYIYNKDPLPISIDENGRLVVDETLLMETINLEN